VSDLSTPHGSLVSRIAAKCNEQPAQRDSLVRARKGATRLCSHSDWELKSLRMQVGSSVRKTVQTMGPAKGMVIYLYSAALFAPTMCWLLLIPLGYRRV